MKLPKTECPKCHRRGYLILRPTHAGTRYELVVFHYIAGRAGRMECVVGSGKARMLLETKRRKQVKKTGF